MAKEPKKNALVDTEESVNEAVAPEEAPADVPAVAKPIEKVGNADVSNFQPLSDKEYRSLNDQQKEDYHARRSKHELITGPQTQFMIPLQPGEKPGATETVSLNGYRINIKKNTIVTIPVPMAQIIAEKYQVEMEAGSHMLFDRDDEHVEALG